MTVVVSSPTRNIRRVVTDQFLANLDVVVIARDYTKVAELVNDGTSALYLGPYGSAQAFLLTVAKR